MLGESSASQQATDLLLARQAAEADRRVRGAKNPFVIRATASSASITNRQDFRPRTSGAGVA